jgi:hypothetical protein
MQNWISCNFSFFFVSGLGSKFAVAVGDFRKVFRSFGSFDLLVISFFFLSIFCHSIFFSKSKFRSFVSRSFVSRSFVGRSFAMVPVYYLLPTYIHHSHSIFEHLSRLCSVRTCGLRVNKTVATTNFIYLF